MSDLCTLLKDEEYHQASRVVRAYNLGDEDKRPSKEAYDSAKETMKCIEEAKGIKVFSKLSEEN